MLLRHKKTIVHFIHPLFLLVFIIFLSVCAGCDSKKQQDISKDEKINVVTTIGMITDIVKNVGGEQVDVVGLMGPGVDPHLYKPTAKDIQRLGSADIIFYNGLHLESKMADILGNMSGDTKTVAVTDRISKELLLSPPGFQEQYDPHLWFDVSLWMKAVENVRDTLTQYKPEFKTEINKNAEVYLGELAELHQYVKTQAERIATKQRVLVTAHDAFNYFGKAYGFEVRGLQGISTVAEASIADLQDLATFIVERRIAAIFVESSVSVRNIEAVKASVRSKGFEVQIGGTLFSDAMGSEGTTEGTYIGMVRHNIDTIVKSLTEELDLPDRSSKEEQSGNDGSKSD